MNLGSMEQRTAGMKRQSQELIEQAYNRGYNAGYEEGKGQTWSEEVKKYEIEPDKKNEYIEQGRNEAWEAVKKLYLPVDEGGLPYAEIKKIFGDLSWFQIITNFSASEVVEKLHAYEEQKKQKDDEEIHIGDEVTFNHPGGTKFIVVSLSDSGKTFDALSAYGAEILLDKSLVIKTGRTFPEVAEFMKKLKESKL